MGGGAAHLPRPRAGRRRRPRRLHLGLPPRRQLPRRLPGTTWLHRIVVNACLDRIRRIKPTSELPEYDLADRHDHHGSVDVRLDVQEALARIPEGQRMALTLVDMHGMSVAEAAEVLDVAEGTIKSRCARGRSALAELLRDKHGEGYPLPG